MHSQLVTVQSALSLASVIDAVYLNIGERGAIKVESHVHGQMQKYLIHHHVLQSHKKEAGQMMPNEVLSHHTHKTMQSQAAASTACAA